MALRKSIKKIALCAAQSAQRNLRNPESLRQWLFSPEI
jgi:hypothetical protein